MEAWEKVLLDYEGYSQTAHAIQTCQGCHGGVNDPSKETAHADLVSDPSEDAETTCGKCHDELIEPQMGSLHYTLAGYETVLASRSDRSDPATWHAIEDMMDNHCSSCHTTCGQCHISQPASVGGGLLEGHVFVETPPMSRTCTACHGSRVGDEYTGKNEGFLADVHFRQGRMACVDCHSGDILHGLGEEGADHRYAGAESPSCQSCHSEALGDENANLYHQMHGETLSCQVCHSVDYKNCDACHTQQTEEGVPYFETEASYLDFKIGLNPRQGEDRPYEYVLLRHVPASLHQFSFYGENLLPNFDSLPTWQYATPHNIQKNTPQTETCQACHNNPELFLTADDVAPAELEANESVIVDQLPSTKP